MPARHTVGCEDGHEEELFVEFGKRVDDYRCSTCGKEIEIVWRAGKTDYQVRLGLVDRL